MQERTTPLPQTDQCPSPAVCSSSTTTTYAHSISSTAAAAAHPKQLTPNRRLPQGMVSRPKVSRPISSKPPGAPAGGGAASVPEGKRGWMTAPTPRGQRLRKLQEVAAACIELSWYERVRGLKRLLPTAPFPLLPSSPPPPFSAPTRPAFTPSTPPRS